MNVTIRSGSMNHTTSIYCDSFGWTGWANSTRVFFRSGCLCLALCTIQQQYTQHTITYITNSPRFYIDSILFFIFSMLVSKEFQFNNLCMEFARQLWRKNINWTSECGVCVCIVYCTYCVCVRVCVMACYRCITIYRSIFDQHYSDSMRYSYFMVWK